MSTWCTQRNERGVATIVVLAFMVLAVPAITALPSFTATVSNESRILREASVGQFSAIDARDYALFRLLNEAGFKESIQPGVPVNEILPLNGGDVLVTWAKRADPGGTLPPEPPVVLTTVKVASVATIPADTPTIVTYTITITNGGAEPESVWEIKDGLPPPLFRLRERQHVRRHHRRSVDQRARR